MNKHSRIEYIFFGSIIAAILAYGISDPVWWRFIGDYWPVTAAICFSVGLGIGLVYARHRGRKQYVKGYKYGNLEG